MEGSENNDTEQTAEGSGKESAEPIEGGQSAEAVGAGKTADTIGAGQNTKAGGNTQKTSVFSSKKFYNFVTVPVIVLVAAFLRMICVEVFTIPFDFAPGGVTGIGTIVEHLTNGAFSSGWAILIVNVPLLIAAFFLIGKRFTIISAIQIVLSSVGMALFGKFVEIPDILKVDEPILGAAAAGMLGGVSLAMMLKIGGTNGGTDIIATFIQSKFKATNVAWFISACDSIVIVISPFVYKNGLTPVLLSLTEMLCYSLVGDIISSGFKTALKFEIITHDPETLARELIEKLGRGVTCVSAVGMYSHQENSLLICVIRKRQLAEFNKILKKYPNTFAYVTNTSEVMGLGFNNGNMI